MHMSPPFQVTAYSLELVVVDIAAHAARKLLALKWLLLLSQ